MRSKLNRQNMQNGTHTQCCDGPKVHPSNSCPNDRCRYVNKELHLRRRRLRKHRPNHSKLIDKAQAHLRCRRRRRQGLSQALQDLPHGPHHPRQQCLIPSPLNPLETGPIHPSIRSHPQTRRSVPTAQVLQGIRSPVDHRQGPSGTQQQPRRCPSFLPCDCLVAKQVPCPQAQGPGFVVLRYPHRLGAGGDDQLDAAFHWRVGYQR